MFFSLVRWSAGVWCTYGWGSINTCLLANSMYFESPEVDMVTVAQNFVSGNNPKGFASTLVHFMGKIYKEAEKFAYQNGAKVAVIYGGAPMG
ncbi:hypothetical protein RchiOBHm_Chr7g0225301 [Rosa chinensis]|uniref:Uncharacterized protein n=1 Tax=Rosa chinensis TaxID=74649 RepID=A0A2P6PE24_ROSCH|nr:hypothetical protein RchiOBHm_Chr7g0225301 [Rosa chinensis]